ncbi:Lytic transglycosylase catalytic [Rhodobacter ferrooxidans]|uniref:Lytic transglycosylase catalytic n=2 Tax=Rhodobacter ferrooxidans TaxID=371731 RepID=C8S4E4_9RHOB|nr:Lytic transglycosylase catalytic [Rhodobacter sp. SW2]
MPARADQADALKLALIRAEAKDWPGAQAAAEPAGAVGRDIVEWQRLRAGEGLLGDYEAFLARRPDWPGLTLLRQKGEVAVARSSTPSRVIGYFDGTSPVTGTGALALAQALQAAGRGAEAEAEAKRAWRALSFTAEDQAALLALYPRALAPLHEARLDRLLWQDKPEEARRMLPLVSPGWRALAKARLALRAQADGVTALVKAVPADLAGHPGLAHERFLWRMKQGLEEDAAALILERSGDSLGDASAWAERRGVLARFLARAGQGKSAYRVASRHGLSEGTDYADLEFLSGFIALRKLDDPETALRHFTRMQAAVSTPISLAKAAYWQGRAEEARGNAEAARGHFSNAARYQTAYYGQLAAEKLGLTLDASLLDNTRPADWREAAFAHSSVLEAGLLLTKAGDRTLAKRFFLHLAESLTDRELAQLADLALTIHEPHIALLIAKQAAERGVIIPRAYFPLTDLVPDGLAVSRALALAIARRESEFDPAARSKAGARGLMQVMPATAKLMAEKLGLPYAVGRLTSDPGYNAAMGAGYLKQLLDEFGPSVAMIAAGYNAGPGRPRRWIGEFGDPRRAEVDVVDWVETIPFAETRTYVMRVTEGLVIYRAKLKGVAGPVRISAELRGG